MYATTTHIVCKLHSRVLGTKVTIEKENIIYNFDLFQDACVHEIFKLTKKIPKHSIIKSGTINLRFCVRDAIACIKLYRYGISMIIKRFMD